MYRPLALLRCRSAVGSATTVHTARARAWRRVTAAQRTAADEQRTPQTHRTSDVDLQRVQARTASFSNSIEYSGVRRTTHSTLARSRCENATNVTSTILYKHSHTTPRRTLICTGSREDSSAIRWLAAPRRPPARLQPPCPTCVRYIVSVTFSHRVLLLLLLLRAICSLRR